MMYKRIEFILKPVFVLSAILLAITSCQESFEEKAQRDAMEFTRKYCPTPVINYMRTDSVSFDKRKRLYTYFCTFVDFADNQEVIQKNKTAISNGFRTSLKESVTMKKYIDLGVRFRMVGRSEKDHRKILLTVNL